jgi:hypothetical protein
MDTCKSNSGMSSFALLKFLFASSLRSCLLTGTQFDRAAFYVILVICWPSGREGCMFLPCTEFGTTRTRWESQFPCFLTRTWMHLYPLFYRWIERVDPAMESCIVKRSLKRWKNMVHIEYWSGGSFRLSWTVSYFSLLSRRKATYRFWRRLCIAISFRLWVRNGAKPRCWCTWCWHHMQCLDQRCLPVMITGPYQSS